jgi:mono/diheme cytochrome c family protein
MRALLTASLILLLPVALRAAEDDDAFFRAKVQPILDGKCISCHGEKKQRHGLRLDSLAAVLAGGKSGPAAIAGKPDDSLIIKAVRSQDEDTAMPPKKQLPPEDVAVLVDWVKRGLPWPSDAASATAAAPATAPAPAP